MTAIRWPLVLTAGAVATATSSLLVAASVLGVLATWGLGIILLPVPLVVIGVMVRAGGAALRRAGVARPNLVAWLVPLPTIPLATVVSTTILLNVIGGRTLPGATFLTVALGAIVPRAGYTDQTPGTTQGRPHLGRSGNQGRQRKSPVRHR